jgi:hypothetical protein
MRFAPRGVRPLGRALVFYFFSARDEKCRARTMSTLLDKSFQVGKYLVSPLTRQKECGHYTASVSIRSGSGRGTSDRVFRFLPEFPTREAALRYAVAEGRSWLRLRNVAVA